MVKDRRPCGSSRTKFARTPTCRPPGKTIWRGSIGMAKSTELGMSFGSSKTRIILVGFRGWDSEWLERSRRWLLCGRNECNSWISENQHHFLTTYIWDVLVVNARRTRVLVNSTEKCSNHESLLQQLKSYQGGRNLTQRWSPGHTTLNSASKGIVNWRTKRKNNCTKFQLRACMITTFNKEELEAVGELSNVCSHMVLKWLYLAFFGPLTNLLDPSQNGQELVANAWLVWFLTFITQMITYSIVMRATQLSIADWVYSTTQILLETLKIENQLRVDSYVGVMGFHAKNEKVLCVRLWNGTCFCWRVLLSSFFLLLSPWIVP